MLKFLTSLTFLYIFSISVLIAYGVLYYRKFSKSRSPLKGFVWVFLGIGLVCFGFLFINFHPPLHLKTFSNLDHYFIRHDGYGIKNKIELGHSDTANFKNRSFSDFTLKKAAGKILISSTYSEEPFYIKASDQFNLVSKNYPVDNGFLTGRADSISFSIKKGAADSYELILNDHIFSSAKNIQKGVNAWNLFKEGSEFGNSSFFVNEKLIASLKNIYLLRENISGSSTANLTYFLSGKIFSYVVDIKYNNEKILPANLAFSGEIENGSTIAWGIGFLSNNHNQFRISNKESEFLLLNNYPVSYPLTEEDRNDWNKKSISKFLVSDAGELNQVPDVFNEGFLFPAMAEDSAAAFSPVLLSYTKDQGDITPDIQAKSFNAYNRKFDIKDNKLELPSKNGNFNWLFSVHNTYNWQFGNKQFDPLTWQLILFGSLGIFFLFVLLVSLLTPSHRFGWIWQLLSCITLVLLTTRFFLYWRYKSFPPYEEMDLPSIQQLNSFWNFGIVVFTAILLGVVFGFSLFRNFFKFLNNRIRGWADFHPKRNQPQKRILSSINWPGKSKLDVLKRERPGLVFFTMWGALLLISGLAAAVKNFETTTCRHLAIVLILGYFIFLHYSYKFSPLVTSSGKSWWKLSTGNKPDILINNPVKVLLSVSLLGLFAFIDIGFAIIFLNFLLFNEAFFCINYSIAGLSAGSNKNAFVFGVAGAVYLLLFALNLTYGPYIFNYFLELPQLLYSSGYVIFAVVIAYMITRLLFRMSRRKRTLIGIGTGVFLFVAAFLFFPKERVLKKAAMTKYRIDVMAQPAEAVIEKAYKDGKTYSPVIRAAQNQWFINTFIFEKNNPAVNNTGFHMLPHAPQNKGAKYNAQATDLVASRFLIAEHSKWAALFYILLLLLPVSLLGSFYKLYPDFTNRINPQYPKLITGFSVLNYLLTTALLVILAATGRYIFFGQDLPFASILSKQSILFPCLLVIMAVVFFREVQPEQYPNRKKLMPGLIVFFGFALLLFLFRPSYNKNKEFTVEGLATNLDNYIQVHLQPILNYFDTSRSTHKLSLSQKDRLFCDSVLHLAQFSDQERGNRFYVNAVNNYCRSGFSAHMDDSRLLFLDMNSGKPQLAVNNNYFRVEPPPHLQQYWAGNVYSDTSVFNITTWDATTGEVMTKRIDSYNNKPGSMITTDLQFLFRKEQDNNLYDQPCLVNRSSEILTISSVDHESVLKPGDTLSVRNPYRFYIRSKKPGEDKIISIQPDAFMKNLYVNGSRYYVYPMANRFIWARNFSEGVSSEYSEQGLYRKNAFLSLNAELTDSLSIRISDMMFGDTSYHAGAEYGICITDGNGRIVAMSDYINGLKRPDPNDKAGFNSVIRGENGIVSQGLLRKQIGNINLLRMNPGPGSTLKPIVFSAVASQLNLDWDAFAAEGFSEKKQYYGGEKVAPYDFEKNNGRITSVKDYLRYSDNYYHSNLLLLGSYSKQSLNELLNEHFTSQIPAAREDDNNPWPWFSYKGKQYWLDGFKNWPGYANGKADFGADSSFVSVGLLNNYGIHTFRNGKSFERFPSGYDSLLFMNASSKSGFIIPELSLFDQKGLTIDHSIPYDLFMSSFRGHVKGSSQVMIPPVKMAEAFGKLISQNRSYSLTLNPYAEEKLFNPFYTDNGVVYSNYVSLMRESVFEGMKEALYGGTASRLGAGLKDGNPYYYYAKTGTTGDDESDEKSKLFVIIISEKDITDPDYNFRNNKFYTIYFTSQNGPAKQNEKFQADIIRLVQESPAFKKYMSLERTMPSVIASRK